MRDQRLRCRAVGHMHDERVRGRATLGGEDLRDRSLRRLIASRASAHPGVDVRLGEQPGTSTGARNLGSMSSAGSVAHVFGSSADVAPSNDETFGGQNQRAQEQRVRFDNPLHIDYGSAEIALEGG